MAKSAPRPRTLEDLWTFVERFLNGTVPQDRVNLQGAAVILTGTGDPNTKVTGNVGWLYLRQDGGAATVLYVKESASGAATGWVAK